MTIPRAILDDAIRRTLPATVAQLCAATGASRPTVDRHLKRLVRLSCVHRASVLPCGSDVWASREGAWAHLTAIGVTA